MLLKYSLLLCYFVAPDALPYLKLISRFEHFVGGRSVYSAEDARTGILFLISWQLKSWVLVLGLVNEMLPTGT